MKTPANPGPTRRLTPDRGMLMAEQRIVAPSLFLLLLLAVIAACGDSGSGSGAADPKGSSPRATLDTDFISRAVAACAPYADYQAKTFLDLQKFNRYAPDPKLLPQVATHLEQNPAVRDAGLGPGGSGHTEVRRHRWDAVLDDFRANALPCRPGSRPPAPPTPPDSQTSRASWSRTRPSCSKTCRPRDRAGPVAGSRGGPAQPPCRRCTDRPLDRRWLVTVQPGRSLRGTLALDQIGEDPAAVGDELEATPDPCVAVADEAVRLKGEATGTRRSIGSCGAEARPRRSGRLPFGK